jgi:hypothetical protein
LTQVCPKLKYQTFILLISWLKVSNNYFSVLFSKKNIRCEGMMFSPKQGRSPSYGMGSLGYPKKNIILELVGMYLYPATPNNKY